MEVAYDVIQESAVPVEQPNESRPAEVVLSAELQQAYKTFSSSAWGKGFSSFLGNVKRQSEEIYEGLTKEVNEVQKEAASELGLLREGIFGRVRGLSLTAGQQTEARADKDDPNALAARDAAAGGPSADDPSPTAGGSGARIETSQLISRFKSEAAKRLLELQKAEDAADEALFRLGSNLATFLGKTVTKVSSQDGADNHNDSQLLFESHDPNSGRRHIHTSRLEAQLHALHTNAATFTQDPCGSSEWNTWAENFDVETKTGDIARDLDRFPELREMLERLTGPSTTDEAKEKVEYSEFWRRYYFVRGIVETGDQKRREMLKEATSQVRSARGADGEEAGWGEDSDDEPDESVSATTGQADLGRSTKDLPSPTLLLHPDSAAGWGKDDDCRDRANSVISDGSYDVVSGATSTARASPKLTSKELRKGDDSDDDWE